MEYGKSTDTSKKELLCPRTLCQCQRCAGARHPIPQTEPASRLLVQQTEPAWRSLVQAAIEFAIPEIAGELAE
jgi:hypothetical protein